jgi:hypothetical protein
LFSWPSARCVQIEQSDTREAPFNKQSAQTHGRFPTSFQGVKFPITQSKEDKMTYKKKQTVIDELTEQVEEYENTEARTGFLMKELKVHAEKLERSCEVFRRENSDLGNTVADQVEKIAFLGETLTKIHSGNITLTVFEDNYIDNDISIPSQTVLLDKGFVDQLCHLEAKINVKSNRLVEPHHLLSKAIKLRSELRAAYAAWPDGEVIISITINERLFSQ